MTRCRLGSTVGLLTVMLLGGPFGSAAQEPVQLKVEKTGDTLCRLGFITVDNVRRVATTPATVNDAVMGGPLEFVGNTKSTVPGEPGGRAYESALELDTDGVTFNLTMVLLWLDHNAAIDTRVFNFEIGDRVEVGMELVRSEQRHRTTIRHGEIYDQ